MQRQPKIEKALAIAAWSVDPDAAISRTSSEGEADGEALPAWARRTLDTAEPPTPPAAAAAAAGPPPEQARPLLPAQPAAPSGAQRPRARLRMESFIGRVSSISDSIGEQSVRALGGVLDGLTSPPSSDRLRGYRDDEEAADGGGGDGQRRPRSSGDDDGDDGRPGGRATIPAASSGGLGGWLGRLALQGGGGGFASAEDALDAEPLVGRGTDGAPGPSRAAGAGLGGGFLGGSFGASLGALPLPAGASSSELLASLRAGASSASSLAAAAAAAARDSGAALASGAVSKAREGTAALSLAGVPLPSSLAAAAEPPPDPACALCARYCPCPGLSYSTRLVGFAVCFLLGFVLSLASLTSLTQLLLGNPRPFATKYTLGNLISLCSSMCAAALPRPAPPCCRAASCGAPV